MQFLGGHLPGGGLWAAKEEEEGVAGARACLPPSEGVVV